ncbi:hypothetical protein [Microbacterium arborescens]|uniref:hypothetical protein n=1 Tax=Microbacterium arborescens TaxID=33883 RepID=UPI00278941ED|nr:hypothetical protein [Microbacterium arborescens]MDQ1218038.1 multisubunit Na+/H+ antiporter MnhG subunit [Microbacterium arborescens]
MSDVALFSGVLMGAGAVISLVGAAGYFYSLRFPGPLTRMRVAMIATCLVMVGMVIGWGGVCILSGAPLTAALIAAAAGIAVSVILYCREAGRSRNAREEAR